MQLTMIRWEMMSGTDFFFLNSIFSRVPNLIYWKINESFTLSVFTIHQALVVGLRSSRLESTRLSEQINF